MNRKSILAGLLCLALMSGCGSSGTIQSTTTAAGESAAESVKQEAESTASSTAAVVNDNRKKPAETNENTAPKPTEISMEDFDIRDYKYETMFGTMWFLIVKNNSDADLAFEFNGTALDAAGNTIGAGTAEIAVLGAGEETVTYFYFEDVTGIDKVTYQGNYGSSFYKPVLSDLAVEQTINDGNLTVKVTNNGQYPAQFVEGCALFMDAENNVVYYNSTYITDSDSEIKPGKTLSAQLDVFDDFDHVEFYMTGRSDGVLSAAAESGISDEDFDIREIRYDNEFATMEYLVIKNNSEKAVEITGNATALSADGSVVGAADCSINVLGPGEESIAYFYFSNVTDVAEVDYSLSYNEAKYYEPVIKDLGLEVNVNDSNVVVLVTNNGSKPAMFVEAYALFYDANNNVVYASSGFVMDSDSEIKPGATLSEQISAYEAFDHVEVYLTGRAER